MIEVGKRAGRAESILMANELINCACVMKPQKTQRGKTQRFRWMNREEIEKNSRTGGVLLPTDFILSISSI